MKVDIIKKFKWYIVGFILVAIMLSVSLSFCTWDSFSVEALIKSKSGGFELKWNDYIKDANGNTISSSKTPQVGDIVTFGNFYQTANSAEKSAIRWIVVHKENNQLSLLAEKVMAFGSFWGTYCYTSSNSTWAGKWGASDVKYHTYYQNYSQSTIRAWLNSNYTLRYDGGTAFSADGKQQLRGFLSEAFTDAEQKYIRVKAISNMKGAGNYENSPQENYEPVEDKVWIPSWSEVYGDTTTPWGNTIDGSPNARFSYFKDTVYGSANAILNGCTTAYASTIDSNYTMDALKDAAMGTDNHQNVLAGGNVWWWLRSPLTSSSSWDRALMVHDGGGGGVAHTHTSRGGVRPAVNIQL